MNDEHRRTGRTTHQLIKLIDDLLEHPEARAVYLVANKAMVSYVQDRIVAIVGPDNPVRKRIEVRARPETYESEFRGRRDFRLVQDHFWPPVSLPRQSKDGQE